MWLFEAKGNCGYGNRVWTENNSVNCDDGNGDGGNEQRLCLLRQIDYNIILILNLVVFFYSNQWLLDYTKRVWGSF